jgi:tetratricopeptide (TPR) repeat protein
VRRPAWWIWTLGAAGALVLVAATPPPNLPQALAAQQQLAGQQPGDPAVLNDLGNLLRLAGRLPEAEEAYQRAIALDPGRVPAHFNLALLLQQRGARDEALAEFQRVVELAPDDAWAHYQIGTILESKGADSQAVQAYARAFALDPNLAFPNVNPHVIENRLLTAALIVANRGSGSIPQAPNAYEDPNRIANLLMPSAPAAAPAAEKQARAGDDEAAAAAPHRGKGRKAKPAVGSANPPQALSEKDLEPGKNLGQASAPGSAPRAPRGGVRAGSTYTVPGYVQGRDATTSTTPSRQPSQGVRVPRVAIPPATPGQRTPGGTRFRPGVASTGRLGSQVNPPD